MSVDWNSVGERLRTLVFKTNGGGYLHYEMNPQFTAASGSNPLVAETLVELRGLFPSEGWDAFTNEGAHAIKLFTDGEVIVGCFNDGDSSLFIATPSIIAFNGDCKKTSNWQGCARVTSPISNDRDVGVGDKFYLVKTRQIFEVESVLSIINELGLTEEAVILKNLATSKRVSVAKRNLPLVMESI
tara:strand:- start:8238 stop:8795 length:558 start_codon:yes stop_codon:yes gene_type:complete